MRFLVATGLKRRTFANGGSYHSGLKLMPCGCSTKFSIDVG